MRISIEDKQVRQEKILQALYQSTGLTELELESLLGLQRRTINNHLRWLQKNSKVYKDGLVWYATKSKATRLIDEIIKLLNELKQEIEK